MSSITLLYWHPTATRNGGHFQLVTNSIRNYNHVLLAQCTSCDWNLETNSWKHESTVSEMSCNFLFQNDQLKLRLNVHIFFACSSISAAFFSTHRLEKKASIKNRHWRLCDVSGSSKSKQKSCRKRRPKMCTSSRSLKQRKTNVSYFQVKMRNRLFDMAAKMLKM